MRHKCCSYCDCTKYYLIQDRRNADLDLAGDVNSLRRRMNHIERPEESNYFGAGWGSLEWPCDWDQSAGGDAAEDAAGEAIESVNLDSLNSGHMACWCQCKDSADDKVLQNYEPSPPLENKGSVNSFIK